MSTSSDLTSIVSLLYGYVLLFPQYALAFWQHLIHLNEWFAKLSPKAKQTILDALNFTHRMVTAVYNYLLSIYPAIMRFGTRDIQDWQQPRALVLKPLSSLVLFFLPVSVEWGDLTVVDKTVYVGNSSIYGFETISVLSSIYQSNGQWPRLVADPMHFKVPFWKHIWELLGAVSIEEYSKLSQASKPVLLLSKDAALLKAFSEQDYQFVPFSNAGPSDMLRLIAQVPYNPRNRSHTLPLATPTSYQRQYAVFGVHTSQDKLDNALITVQQLALQRQQDAGDTRYLLGSVSRAYRHVFKPDGILDKSLRWSLQTAKNASVRSLRFVAAQLEDKKD
ncbi:hypothetical protein EDD86DRAFT_207727 [Gorgonomyces haynaldii]|nr:hypothetical protein EDD86DRAFT_207727 [Gorgonomyces haynaldii]